MKSIIELVNAVSPYLIRKTLDQIGGKKDSLKYRLYVELRKENATEDSAAKAIYGPGQNSLSDSYRSLKNRLSKVLISIILSDGVQNPSYKTYDDAYEHGYRQLEVARILMKKRLYQSAREVASQTFRRVRHFENPPLNFGLADILSSLHLGVAYSEELFAKYHALYVYYGEVCQDLNTITNHYRLIRNHLYANRLAPVEIGELASQYSVEDAPLKEKHRKFPSIQTMYAQTELTGLMLRGQYRQAIASAEEGIQILKNCKGANVRSIAVLALSRIDCTIKLRDFKLGIQQIEVAKKTVPKGTINDLKIYEYSIRLGLLTANYEYAYQSIIAVEKSKLNKLLTPRHQEFWTVLTAYIQMLVLAGEIVVKPDWPKLKQFRLGSFLNDVPVNVRNKRGTNIQILILQAVILILQGKHGAMIDRTDSLSVYCSRYLRDDNNLRNNGFFKLLLNVIQGGFRRGPAERRAVRTLQKMREAEVNGHQNNLELIPYENLWEIILKHLEQKRNEIVVSVAN